MLVLTRRCGEAIQVGRDITVTVLDVQASRVRIGISAPADVLVLREELAASVESVSGSNRALPDDR